MQHFFTQQSDPFPPVIRRLKWNKLLFCLGLLLIGLQVKSFGQASAYQLTVINAPNAPVDFNDLISPSPPTVNVVGKPYMVDNVPSGTTTQTDGSVYSPAGVYKYPNVGTNFSLGLRTDNLYQTGYYGVVFRNNTGQPIKCLRVRYKAMQWNKGNNQGYIERQPFSVLVSSGQPNNLLGPGWVPNSELDATGDKFNAPCGGGPVFITDGLNPTYQSLKDQTIFFPTAILPGEHITLRWQVINQGGSPCFQPSLSIDDLELTPYSEAKPVSGLTVTNSGTSPCYGIAVNFTPPSNFNSALISGYEVQVDTNGSLYRTINLAPTITSVFVDANRSASIVVRVRTMSPQCNPSNPAISSFFLPAPTPINVTALPAVSCGGTNISLTYSHLNLDNVIWESKPGLCGNASPFQPANLVGGNVTTFVTQTTCFRAKISYNGPYVCERTSQPVQITINQADGGFIQTNSGTVFCGTATGLLGLGGQIGNSIVWEKQPNCVGNFNATTITNTTILNFTGLTETTCFRTKVTSAGDPFCYDYSDPFGIQVNQNPIVAPASASRPTICAGDTNRVFVNFFSGDLQWQKDPNCTNNWTNVANLGPNNTGRQYYYNTGALTQNYCYRAIVSRSGCSDVISPVANITVLPAVNLPVLAGPNQVCANGVDSFRVSNFQNGVQYNWSGWPQTVRVVSGQGSPILVLSFLGVNSGAFDLHVTATSGSCSRTTFPSNGLPVNIVPQTQPGNLTPEFSTLCSGSQNPVTLTVSGHVGNIIRWESSTDNFVNVTTISQSTTTLQVQNLTQTTRYRAIVKSGSCLDIPTRVVTVQVSGAVQGGTLTSNVSAVCGSPNSAFLSLNGFMGQVVRWESSTDNFNQNIVTINNVNTFLNVSNLTQSTSYRAIVSVIGCAEERSTTVSITVTPQTVPGILNGTSNVCGGTNTGTINLTGNTGDILLWESSTNNFFTANNISNTTATLTFNDLHQNTQFRALVRNGSCDARYTQVFNVTVSQQINPGQLIGAATLCAGTNSGSIQLIGNNGNVIRWESSKDGFINITTIANTANTQTYSNLTETTSYRAVVQNPLCGEATSTPISITIIGSGNGGTITAINNSVCRNNATYITLSGNTAPIQKWQKSAGSCNGPWADIFTNTSSINTGFLQEATCFRAVVSNPNCNQVFSNALLIEVNGIQKDSIRVAQISCRDANDGVIRLFFSGSNNLEYSINNGQTFSPNSVFSNLTPGNYLVIVRDRLNPSCVAPTEFVNISQPVTSFDITDAVVRNADCRNINNPTGGINITVQGGTPPYTFLWSNQSTTEDLVNVAPGNYTVTVTDNNGRGCRRSVTYTVGGASFFTISGQVTNVTCGGSANGVIVITVVGGSQPMTFRWNDNVTTQNRTNIPSGTYTVTVTDDLGCVQSRSFTVSDGSNISLSFTAQDVPCQNSGTGSITVSATGGTAPYTYRWSNGQLSNSIFGLNAGTYMVTATDANGCTKIGEKAIVATSGPTAPTATASSPEACLGSAVRLSATSSDIGVQFQWFETQDGIFAFNVGSLIEVTPNSLGQKTYYVQAVYNNRPSCPSTRVPVSFTVVQGVQAGTVSGTTQICSGQAATMSITPAPQMVIRWEASRDNFATSTTISNQTPTLSIPNLTQTTAFRAVVRSGSCPETTTNAHTVNVSQGFSAGFISGASSVCSGTNNATLLVSQNSPNTSIVRWESSTDNFNQNIVTINNTNLSLQVSNLLQTTSYRAVVQGGNCPMLTTQPATITVNNCGGIAVSEQSLAFGDIRLGCESLQRTYRVTGANLTGNISVEAPTGILIATDFIGPFQSTLTLNQTNGNVSATIYVKVSNNAPFGAINGIIIHRSNAQNTVTMNVSANVQGAGTPQFVTNPTVLTFGEVVVNTPSLPNSYLLTATNLTGNSVSLQVSAPYGISLNPAGPFTTTLSIPVQGCSVESRIYVRFTPQVVGQATELIVHSNNGQQFTLQASGFGIFDPQTQLADVVVSEDFGDQNSVDNMFGSGQFTFGVNAFTSLQTAIDRTGPNKTLFLAGSNFRGDNVVVDNPITITGQGKDQTFIAPRGNVVNNYGGDDPTDALNPFFQANHAFVIRSNDVKVRNLTIDGGSSNSCESRFGVGIITDNQSSNEIRNLEIENVNIRHVYSRGIQLSGSGRTHDIRNVEIVDVCQRNNPNARIAAEASGIFSDDPVSIQDITVRDAGSGIILRNFGGLDEMTAIQRSVIENVFEDGIQVDMRSNSRGELRIQGNTINGVGDVGIEAMGLTSDAVIGGVNDDLKNHININSNRSNDPATGIRVSFSDGTLVQNNEINGQGKETGIELFQNDDFNNPIIIRRNNLRRTGNFESNPTLNESVGVFMSDNGQYVNAPNAPSYARMEGNNINGFNIGIFTNGNSIAGNVYAEILPDANGISNTISNTREGVRVNGSSRARIMNNARSIENSDVGIYVYGGDLYMEGNSLRNNRIAVLVEDKPSITGTATIFSNTFTNNVQNIVNNSTNTSNIVNASWNWWGTNVSSDVRNKLSGKIDFSPFFDDSRDADNNLDNGWSGIRDVVNVDAVSLKTAPAGNIQEAVNESRVVKVKVVDGIYDETLSINRSVTLTNDGIGSNPIVMNLTMANTSATLTMDQSFDLTGQLTLNGGRIVMVGDKVLTILRGGNASQGSDNSYVNGSLARQAASTNNTDLYYPIGSNNAFRPATLSVTQSSNVLNTYTGRLIEPNNVVHQLPSNVSSVSATRVHNFRRSGGADITAANIRLAYGNGDPFATNQNSLTILKDNDGFGSVWTEVGGNVSGSTVSSANPFNSLGNFVLGLKPIDSNNGGNNGGGNNGGGGTVITASEITNVNNITVSSALVVWSVPSCIGPRYEFRFRVTGESNWTTIQNVTTNSYYMMGLQSGTRYEISVRSICPNQPFSDWSTTQLNSFTTLQAGSCDGAVPPVPGGVLVNNIAARTARVSWNLVTNGNGQGTIINFGPINVSPNLWTQAIVCHPENSFFFTNLQPNTVYGVRIRTNCSNCTTAFNSNDRRSNWSQVIAFSTPSSREGDDVLTGVSGLGIQNLNLYPNPNEGTFNVSFVSEKEEDVIVRILDVKGATVFNRTFRTTEGRNELPIELNGFAEGIYNLMILKGSQATSTKLQIR